MVEQFRDTTDFGILLGLAYQGFTDQLRASLATQGFTDLGNAYGYVLRALAHEKPSQRELAARLGITDQGMAKILSEMVVRGYVERVADSEDARVKRLRLGRRGRAALAAARRFHATFQQRLENEVGSAAVAKLRTLLNLIASGGDEHDLASARLRPT